ncbi:MAG: PEGA domain-containing protein [Elusimicrobia bacterium]|nr:PEGA domain-containing protein [Elusimicrobiota bacterium]
MQEKYRILAVDKDEGQLSLLKIHLEKEGYDYASATDGASAENLASENSFDILICDYNLPDINGLELISKIKKLSKDTVPLLITSVRSMDVAMQGMRIGVYEYLPKPIDYDELNRILLEIVQEREKFKKGQEWLKENALKDAGGEPGLEKDTPPGEAEGSASLPAEEASPAIVNSQPGAMVGQVEGEAVSEVSTESPAPLKSKPLEVEEPEEKPKSKILPFIIGGVVLIGLLVFILLRFIGGGSGRQILLETQPPGLLVEISPELLPGALYSPVMLSGKIKPGYYNFRIFEPGYLPYNKDVNIAKGYTPEFLADSLGGSLSQDKDGTKIIISLEELITLDSYPEDAEVYIDGVMVSSSTPFQTVLSCGRDYRINLRKEGYNTLGEETGNLILRPGNIPESRIDYAYWKLEETSEMLYITGSFWEDFQVDILPEDAFVYVNDEMVEYRDGKLRLPLGESSLRLVREGFEDWEDWVNLPEDEPLSIRLVQGVRVSAYDAANPDNPVEASVRVNGNLIEGRTPLTLPIAAGKNNLVFSAVGYSDSLLEYNYSEEEAEAEISVAMTKQVFKKATVEVLRLPGNRPVSGATVRIGRRSLGQTDARGRLNVNLAAGRHVLIAEATGTEARRSINLISDGDLIRIELPPLPELAADSEIIIDSRPHYPGAIIFVNGESGGDTLTRLPNLKPGTYSIRIEHSSFGYLERELDLPPSSRKIINLDQEGEFVIR